MWKQAYQNWVSYKDLDKSVKDELISLKEDEILDCFYTNLTFGTGGIRGVLGPGINRLNIYTIRRANEGFAKYLLSLNKNAKDRGVVIAYDNRNMSIDFAYESAKVLGKHGIKTYIFESLRPTPELSFAVRNLNAIGGIVVTASHNPPEYNGYKIYDEDGCQLVPRYANKVIEYVNEIEDIFEIEVSDVDDLMSKGLIEIIGKDIDDKYNDALKSVEINKGIKKDIKIVFTPLHGTSAKPGLRVLTECGYDVHIVKEQFEPDANFSTVSLPNPEHSEAFEYAKKLGKEINGDILIATDPDADRLGVAVKDKFGEYVLLTGNQTGAIMLEYLLSQRKLKGDLPKKGMVFNTVVTGELGAVIAKSYGFDVVSTLTGFKFIGEQMKLLEDTDNAFIFGYEESFGYVVKDFVRDKDSIQAMLLISEACAYYHNHGKTLLEVLLDLYNNYGTYREHLENIVLKGKAGSEKISLIMDTFRNSKLNEINNNSVLYLEDYANSIRYFSDKEEILNLPKSNVLKYVLENGSWFVLRPSGTEPKLKIYIGVKDKDIKTSDNQIKELLNELLVIIGRV